MLQVYGLDQYGMDSGWRLSLGLAPLPPPEVLEEEMRASGSVSLEPQPQSDETEAETSIETDDTESGADASVQAESTEAPTEAKPSGEGGEQESGGSSSPCSAPPPGTASVGLGALALMATPLSLARVALPPAGSGETPTDSGARVPQTSGPKGLSRESATAA